jgi:hypothetical protein
MMTQIDEVNSDRHFQMTFVEFLEAIGRVAECAQFHEPNSTEVDLLKASVQIDKLIENMMPKLVAI